MNLKKIINNILEILRNFNRLIITNKLNKHRIALLKNSGLTYKKLNESQKKEVDSVYKKYKHKYDDVTHELVLSVTGVFSPNIIPEGFFRTFIDPILNDYDFKYVFSDKNYFEIFMPSVNFPKSILHNIRGTLYDSDYHILNKEQAYEIVKKI